MSRLKLVLLTVFISVGFFACEKSDSDPYKCATCIKVAEARAAHDVSSKGIYKGVVIGSTGTIQFDVQNDGSSITAVMVLDGVTVNLSSSVVWVNAQPYIALFTGTMNGSAVTITFSVDANGGNPVITSSTIPGHATAEFILIKETSTALVEAFEGTYSTTKPETGTFNILLSRVISKWGGINRKDGTVTNNEMDGTIDSNGRLLQDGTDYIGTLSGDEINGSFQDGSSNTVTVTGKRKI